MEVRKGLVGSECEYVENEVYLCARVDTNRQAMLERRCTTAFDLFWFTRRYFAPFIRNLFLRVIEGGVLSLSLSLSFSLSLSPFFFQPSARLFDFVVS